MDQRKRFSDQARLVEIRIQGQLDESWPDWLEGMEVTVDDHLTTLRGVIPDQAALRGILSKIWDVNLFLISVNTIEKGSSDTNAKGERS
jgi:hypothetical protein